MDDQLIMIVDDTPAKLKLFKMILTRAGYSVKTTARADEVTPLLQTLHPCLVLVDIRLDTINGLTLARTLKADPQTRDIPVLLMTVYADEWTQKDAQAAGADGFLVLPVSSSQFLEKVRSLLKNCQPTEYTPEQLPAPSTQQKNPS